MHHSHLDLGTFVLELGGVRWAVDLGKDSYGLRKYNSHLAKSPRWNYLRPSNRGHNTVSLGAAEGDDGGGNKARERKAGREWPRPGEGDVQCLDVLAPITHFLSSADRGHAVVDLSYAYAWPYLRKKALKEGLAGENPRSIHRGAALWNGRSEVLLRDEITVHGSTWKGKNGKNVLETGEYVFPVAWRMHTEAAVVVDAASGGRVAVLSQRGQQLRLEIAAPTPAHARFTVRSALPDSLRGVDLSTLAHKEAKPDTEDPNFGVSVLTIELTMSSADKAAGAGQSCGDLGATCAGQEPCQSLVIAVRATHGTLSKPIAAAAAAAALAQPLAQWGGAVL